MNWSNNVIPSYKPYCPAEATRAAIAGPSAQSARGRTGYGAGRRSGAPLGVKQNNDGGLFKDDKHDES
jgi:hypothetical protein